MLIIVGEMRGNQKFHVCSTEFLHWEPLPHVSGKGHCAQVLSGSAKDHSKHILCTDNVLH